MALNRLCTSFWQMIICRQSNIVGRYCSSYLSKRPNDIVSLESSSNVIDLTCPKTHITFVPRTLNIDFGNPDNISEKTIIKIPFNNIPSMEEPLKQYPVKYDLPIIDKSVQLPSTENIIEKLAIRLVVIRRKKMKKHKRRKLRRRMKFEWAKIRYRRNKLKEKAFQAQLLEKIKEAEMFDPEEYINEKLVILQKEWIPRTYKGEVLPQSMIKQFLEEDKKKREMKRNKFRLKLD